MYPRKITYLRILSLVVAPKIDASLAQASVFSSSLAFLCLLHNTGSFWQASISNQAINICTFYASATENLWCQRHSLFGCVRPWVSLCILKTLWVSYLKNQWGEFLPIVVTDIFGRIDLLIRYSYTKSKVKVTIGNDLKNRVNTVSL